MTDFLEDLVFECKIKICASTFNKHHVYVKISRRYCLLHNRKLSIGYFFNFSIKDILQEIKYFVVLFQLFKKLEYIYICIYILT